MEGTSEEEASEEEASEEQALGTWITLERSWYPFLEWLGDRWWDYVSKRRIESFLAGTDVEIGAVVVSAYRGTRSGAVCSITVKNHSGLSRCSLILQRGYYRCTEVMIWPSVYPVRTIEKLVEKVERGHLVSRPGWIRVGPHGCPGTRVVEEMRHTIEFMQGAWWGPSNRGSHRRKTLYELFVLRRRGAPEENPAGAVWDMECWDVGYPAARVWDMDEGEQGYLFEIVSGKGEQYTVTFNGSGFRLGKGPGVHFSTIVDLLNHATRAIGVTFSDRPFLTLQELCRDSLDAKEVEHTDIPRRIKDFLRDTRYEEQ
ncbi:hypothetical protein KUCAC02_033104 [Chaenocephalus aceratus]|nr:hypothetical protein KUCAC02_033104 [Chaenocephalus aceratus]